VSVRAPGTVVVATGLALSRGVQVALDAVLLLRGDSSNHDRVRGGVHRGQSTPAPLAGSARVCGELGNVNH
jgi:hypothetical protein